MTKAAHLSQWFLLGCAASILADWLAAQLQQGILAVVAINLVVLCFWALGWLLDDGIMHLIKIHPLAYYTALIAWGAAHLIGLILYLWMYHPLSTV